MFPFRERAVALLQGTTANAVSAAHSQGFPFELRICRNVAKSVRYDQRRAGVWPALRSCPCASNLTRTTLRIMAWMYLVVAGLLEVGWAIGLKHTQGFSRVWPSVMTVSAMIASFVLLAQALKTIPVGTGYAAWTGIGAAGTAIIGMAFLGESREALRILCIVLIVAGVVGLKYASTAGH